MPQTSHNFPYIFGEYKSGSPLSNIANAFLASETLE